jgi:hypothetical protein
MIFLKRKVFISHYKGDRRDVDDFIKEFEDVLIPKVLGANDNDEFINSTNTDYVMQRIREKYLEDSTVTIVLIGSCTHSRRYVDWEIKSSLQQGRDLPNGLLGIAIPRGKTRAHLPERFKCNWKKDGEGYAKFKPYPSSEQQLWEWIEDAYQARTARANLIDNSLSMMGYNLKCKICEETH